LSASLLSRIIQFFQVHLWLFSCICPGISHFFQGDFLSLNGEWYVETKIYWSIAV